MRIQSFAFLPENHDNNKTKVIHVMTVICCKSLTLIGFLDPFRLTFANKCARHLVYLFSYVEAVGLASPSLP